MQKTLFNSKVKSKTAPKIAEAEAIKFLKARGYTIQKTSAEESSLVSNMSIIDFFYTELTKVVGEERVLLTKQEDRDLKSIQRYQCKAKKLGISIAKANQYLYNAIKLFFYYRQDIKNNDKLKEIIPYNITFLLNQGAWIISEVLNLHRTIVMNYNNSEEVEQYKNKIYDTEDDVFLKLQAERHKKILNS